MWFLIEPLLDIKINISISLLLTPMTLKKHTTKLEQPSTHHLVSSLYLFTMKVNNFITL